MLVDPQSETNPTFGSQIFASSMAPKSRRNCARVNWQWSLEVVEFRRDPRGRSRGFSSGADRFQVYLDIIGISLMITLRFYLTWLAGKSTGNESLYFNLLKMGIFQCNVRFLGCNCWFRKHRSFPRHQSNVTVVNWFPAKNVFILLHRTGVLTASITM